MKKFQSFIFLMVILSWMFTSAFKPLPQSASFNPSSSLSVAAAPSAFLKNSPANNSTDQPVTGIVLKWAASDPGVTYQYCIRAGKASCNGNHWVTAGSPAETGFYSVTLTGTLSANTNYFWQVRAISGNSTTYANNGAWFKFKTSSGAPLYFSKTSPANGAPNQELSVTLSWQPSTNALYYDYCLSTSTTCTAWVPVGNITSAQVNGLAYGTPYYWQVRSRIYTNASSGATTYANSETMWTFTTKPAPPAPYNKVSPADLVTNQPTFINLQWGPSTGAAEYKVCIQTSASCTADQEITTGTNTSYAPVGLELGTTYYWQVFAVNGTSRTAADGGDWHSFTTWTSAPAPSDFKKLSPQLGETDQPLAPWLYWSTPAAGSNFEYCFASSTFTSNCPGGWKTVAANTIIKLPNSAYPAALANNTTYYWQVRYPAGGGAYVYADTPASTTPSPFSFTTLKAGPVGSDLTDSIAEDDTLTRQLTATSNYGKVFEVLGALPTGVALDANFSANGTFTYTPAANFNGQVTFQYEVNDGINQPAGPYIVTINVTPDDDTPAIAAVAPETALPGDLVIKVMDASDADLPYGDTLTYSIVEALPAGATFDGQTGVFAWNIADTQALGTYNFTVQVTDSTGLSSTTTMKIIVATIPVTGGGYTINIPLVTR